MNYSINPGQLLVACSILALTVVAILIYRNYTKRQDRNRLDKLTRNANRKVAKLATKQRNLGNRIFNALKGVCSDSRCAIGRDPNGSLGYAILVEDGGKRVIQIFIDTLRSENKQIIVSPFGPNTTTKEYPATDEVVANLIPQIVAHLQQEVR